MLDLLLCGALTHIDDHRPSTCAVSVLTVSMDHGVRKSSRRSGEKGGAREFCN